MPGKHPPTDADEKRLRAELTSLRLNSEWARVRRRDRIRWLVAVAVVGLAAWKVPWRQLTAEVLERLDVQVSAVDGGSPYR